MTEIEEDPAGPKSALLGWMLGIFTNPRATFTDLQQSISLQQLLVPLLLVLAVSVTAEGYLRPLAIEEQRSHYSQRDDLTEEQMEAILDRLDEAAVTGAKQYLLAGLAGLAWLAILTGVVMFFGNFILGGEGRGAAAATIVVFVSLIGILELAVKVPLIIQAGSTQVETGLALLLPRSMDGSLLYRFFHRLDFFGIWKVGLTALGTAILFRVPEKQAGYAYFGAWAGVMLLMALIFDRLLMG